MHEPLIRRIESELGKIELLFQDYETLFHSVMHKSPDLVEVTALASVLHSFYTGTEAILLQIARKVDEYVPEGQMWHSKLIDQMGQANSERDVVLSAATIDSLHIYRAFRHIYRHNYSNFLDWERMKPLVDDLESTFQRFKSDIFLLLNNLRQENPL